MNRVERGIKSAIEATGFVTHSRYRVGAAIYLGNKLISIGWNKDKTSTRAHGIFRWQHAELAAIIGTSKFDLTRATMYVARVTPTGTVRISKPCADCQRILRAAGIKRVFYTTNCGKIKRLKYDL